MKHLKYVFAALIAVMFFTVSCEKDDVTDTTPEYGEVSFDVENFITGLESKDGKLSNNVICNDDLTPDFVYVKLNDGTTDFVYELELVTLETSDGKMQTEVLKLEPGPYTIKEFAVYNGTANDDSDTDTVLFASPEHSSTYVSNWQMIGVGQGSTPFTVEAFKKGPIPVDVICYVPSAYVDFGFSWFQFDKFKSKKIYFFGDVCTKFWEEWRDETGSPYANTIVGYDFVANFKVDVYKGTDTIGAPNVTGIYDAANPPVDGNGVAQPLCVEYVDNINSIDENYTFVISLLMPTGEYEDIHVGSFTDANWSMVNPTGTEDTTLNFGGLDGVFDFVVGNCSYDGNDANLELPAYLPIPTSGKFKYVSSVEDGYVGVQFKNLVGLQNDLTIANTSLTYPTQPMWCVAKNDNLGSGWYQANFYSSIDPSEVAKLDSNYDGMKWGALNWLVNNKDGYTKTEIQAAIWFISDNDGNGNQLSTDALANSDFVPTVGDWAIVIIDAIESSDSVNDVQLMIVRVDP